MRIGKITVGSLNEWVLAPGTVTSWHPTPASAEKARHAPVSSVPVSYMQGQHLRNYCDRTAAGLNFSRQIIASCDVPGECDIAAMDVALNAYLRRHDTFRSWFEHTDDDKFIRHTITDPADIEFEPIDHGHMTVDEIRGTPSRSRIHWSGAASPSGSSSARASSRSSSRWTTCTGTRR